MYSENHTMNLILTVLFFPLLFQEMFFNFAVGSVIMDPLPVLILKWIFLLIPCLTFIGACWITVVSLITIIFRYKRLSFIVALILTWWDYFKSLLYYWGGIFKAVFTLIMAALGLIWMVLLTILYMIRDIILIPGRLFVMAGKGVTGSSVPWIAVCMTLIAAILESAIFTPIMTPVVMDIVPVYVSVAVLQTILFIIIFTLVMASFAVLTVTFDTVKKKQIGSTVMITIIELVVIWVEVTFLYREFVDALVPWFAQYQEGFELGPMGTIAIAFVAWIGVRSMVWFLFASHGAPVIMAIIQGRQLNITKEAKPDNREALMQSSTHFFSSINKNNEWIKNRGNDIINAILLPPLQILAATINFLILLLYSRHMFELPFHKLSEIRPSADLVDIVRKPRYEDT